jgi:hypothetical protein
MQLHDRLELVTDESTFLAFVEALADDRRSGRDGTVDKFGRNENGWENHSIEDFLEAGLAWAQSSDFGATQDLASASPWKKFAAFLYCGKIYE